ncbi:hypothetical protein OH492_28550 [Vibrio chagasii]|nr:hypothetical protein [Vibrio chagasii]
MGEHAGGQQAPQLLLRLAARCWVRFNSAIRTTPDSTPISKNLPPLLMTTAALAPVKRKRLTAKVLPMSHLAEAVIS